MVADTAVAPDGKVVVGGTKGENMAVARLNADGTIDTSFGVGGLFESTRREQVTSVAVQGDGKIILGFGVRSYLHETDFHTGRLLASGSGFDGSFGLNGIATFGDAFDSSSVNDVAVQRDGKILAAGYREDSFGGLDYDFAVVRYDANGSIDATFDGDGLGVYGFGGDEEIKAVTIDYNNPGTNPLYGTIVATGTNFVNGNDSRFLVLRLRPDGTGDPGFDGDGKLTSPDLSGSGGESAVDVVVQPGGRIVVAGTAFSHSVADARNFLIAGYTAGGALDNSFGVAGGGVTELDLGGRDEAGTIAIGYLNSVGNLLVAGSRNNQFAVVALGPNGELDTRFSGDGILNTTIPGHATGLFVTGSLIAPARKLLVAGSDQVARYVDVGSWITVSTSQPNMYEQGERATSFIVARTQSLPIPETIVLGTSGTATTRGANRDFNGTNILFGNGTMTATEVVIPADATEVQVTLTPRDDVLVEGDETIGFTVGTTVTYDAGSPNSTTLVVRDNDNTGAPAVIASSFWYETGPQRVSFSFSQSVAASISAADFQVTGPAGMPSTTFTYDDVTNTATLSFNGILPDGNYAARAIATGITNAAGQPLPADYVLEFFFLNGDANRDGRVNLQDFNRLAANFGRTGSAVFSQADFNYDRNVNLQDFNILAARFGTSFSPARGASDESENRIDGRILDLLD